MSKPIPHAHRFIIARANALGYFPLPRQAKDIARVSAMAFGLKYPTHRGAVPDSMLLPIHDAAIKAVMETPQPVGEPVSG